MTTGTTIVSDKQYGDERDRHDGNHDLRRDLNNRDLRPRIEQRARDRASHETSHRMEYDMVHGPSGPKQFTNHLRQVVCP
jgi:hypothetical protein